MEPNNTGTHAIAPKARHSSMHRRVFMRVLKDSRYGAFAVYEQDLGETGKTALVFDGQDIWLHLEDYPASWRKMSVDQLVGLFLMHRRVDAA